MTTQCVQVKLELGHKAVIRTKPTSEGFTHDWTVFVRGPEGSNINHFVEKVSFLLHESFPRPKRIVKDPPYQVSESGYAGFLLPIEVYFKNKEEPKRVRFEYDLFLHIEGPPVNHIRCEKLTFQNPTEDFRRKLIKAGGVGILSPDGGTILGQQPDAFGGSGEVVTITSNPPAVSAPASKSSSKVSPEPVKKPRSITSSKGNVPPSTPASRQNATPAVQSEPEPFVALFGPPIKTNKASPDSRKIKDGSSKGSSGKSSKGGTSRSMASSSTSNAPVMAARKEPKSTTKLSSSSKETKQTSPDNVSGSLVPEAMKNTGRVTTPSPVRPATEISGEKKRKRVSGSSTSSTTGSSKSKVRDVKKKKRDSSEKKEKVKQSKSDKKSSKNSKVVEEESKTSSKTTTECPPPPPTPNILTNTKTDAESSRVSSPDTSPESSISFSSLHISGKRGPLGTLMAELDEDDDDELVSPLSSDPPSPPRFSTKTPEPRTPTITPTPTPTPKAEKEKKTKKHKSHSETKHVDVPRKEKENDTCDLNLLYQQICTLQNKEHLQQIADVIEETGLYTVTSSTLDFDLRALDTETIRKLRNLVPAF